MADIKIKFWLYRIVSIIMRIGFSPFFRIRIIGRENLPEKGAYILLPKHQRWEDIPMTAFITPRPMFYIAKIELFRFRRLARLMIFMGGIPLDRENPMRSRNSFKAALKVLKRGDPLVIFPEGTYFVNCMGPGHEGMVRFILSRSENSNTFLPVGIQYQPNGLRTNVNIRIGKPVTVPPAKNARPFLDNMIKEIARLSDLD